MKNQYKFKGEYTSIFDGGFELTSGVKVTVNLSNKEINLDIEIADDHDDLGMSESEYFTINIDGKEHIFNIDIDDTNDIKIEDREKLFNLVEKLALTATATTTSKKSKVKKF